MMNSTAQAVAQPVRPRRRYSRYGPHRVRMAFRRFRRSRPFWGGLWTILGGLIITAGPASAYKVVALSGTVVWEGILTGVLVTVCGLFLWFQPSARHFFGVLATILATLSFVTSDLGGLLIGMLLGITGGSMGFAWVPVDPAKVKPHIWHRQARHRWKDARRAERAARRLELEDEEYAEIGVRGRPVEEPVPGVLAMSAADPASQADVTAPAAATPAADVGIKDQAVATPAADLPAATIEKVGAVDVPAVETRGEEVDRLPAADAATTAAAPAHAAPVPDTPTRRRFSLRRPSRR